MTFRALIAAAAVALAVSPALAQQSSPRPSTAGDPTQGARNDTPSATFVRKAAVTDLAEIEMAKLALEKSQNANVRQFAQKMIDEHGKMSQQLKQAAGQDKIAVAAPTQPDKPHADKLAELRKESGANFDRKYVEAQVKGHQEAVALFEGYARNGADPNIKKAATEALPHIRQHLQQAQALQRQVQTAEVPAGGNRPAEQRR